MPLRQLIMLALGTVLCACTAPNPDYRAEGCRLTERQCVQSLQRPPAPVVCGIGDDGEPALLGERCPEGAACEAGLCTAPKAQRPCARQSDCNEDEACVPLVNPDAPKTLTSVCLPRAPKGTVAAGECCTKDSDCASHLCLPFGQGHACLKLCQGQSDCPIPGQCQRLSVTITGVSGAIMVCSPGLRKCKE